MKNIPKIIIGIPAYNEEANIKVLLQSVCRQKTPTFILSEIIVISDGSTDDTVARAREVRDSRIKVIEYEKRIGKSQHLNTLFTDMQAEIIVLFDADVVPAHDNVLVNLVTPLLNDERVGLVGGNPQPTLAKTFIERGVNATFRAWSPLRTIFKGGNNAFGCDGRILALSRKFASSVTVPEDMIANDAFLYFSCITEGFLFKHVENAQVWFTSPKSIKDQVRQNKRFIAARYRLRRMFGDVVLREYAAPKLPLYKMQVKEFTKSPLSSTVVFIVNLYCKIRAKNDEKKMNAKWLMAESTKKEILTPYTGGEFVPKQTKALITVSIGIPAYNEEANIEHLIKSLLLQKEENFVLREIIVVSDGSNDRTEDIAQSFHDSRIKVIGNTQRVGQAFAQNEIFQAVKSDIVVILEADIVPKSFNYLTELIKPIIDNGTVGLVQGNLTPLPGNRFFGRALKAQIDVYHDASIKDTLTRNWITSGRGGRAFARRVYEKLIWPNAVPEDTYAVLWCYANNIPVVFQETAVCYYRCSETLSDFVRERSKIAYGKKALENHFSADNIGKIYKRPRHLRMRMLLKFMLCYPLYFAHYLWLKIALVFLQRDKQFSDFWEMTTSTKNLSPMSKAVKSTSQS